MSSDKKEFSRKDAARMASSLRKSRDWDPEAVLSTKRDPLDVFREEVREQRTAEKYDSTATCGACASERAETGDETALCPEHFSAMMEGGF